MAENVTKNQTFGDIYRFIYKKNGASRKQIASELDLSLPTVTNYLQNLMDSGYIHIDGTLDSTGGRKANTYSVVPDSAYAIGVDITKNHLTAVLVDLRENIIDSYREKTIFSDSDEYYFKIGQAIEQLIDDNNIDTGKLIGIGVSLPALIDEDQKHISYAKAISIDENAYDTMAKYINYPFLLYNDANSAGLAEWWKTRQDNLAVYLSLKQSIGGATINGNNIYAGNNNRASEFGHVTIVPGGRRCYCGRKGCVDAYCSENELINFTDGNLQQFFDELPDNPGYQRVFDSYLHYLSLVVHMLRVCYDCDIIIGGNVGAYLEQYIDVLKAKAIKLNPFETNADYIRICQYKNSASAVGAALYFVKDYIDEM